MISFSIGSEQPKLTVTVHSPDPATEISFLCISAGGRTVEINIFRRGPQGIQEILDLGYEIVHECRELQEKTASQPELASEGNLNV
jgi:hypothetical protein